MEKKIILFCRAPKLGWGKSRLKILLDEKERFFLSKRLLENIFSEIKKTGLDYVIHYDGDEEDILYLSNNLVKQEGKDLGERMRSSIKSELENNKKVILVGADLVGLTSDYIKEAFSKLDSYDVVIGPTKDGGYGLIGMKEDIDLFSNITYSQEDVFEKTLARAKEKNKSLFSLDTIMDIDRPEDLVALESGCDKVALLGYGEYNLNYKLGDDRVFRINIGSQLHLGEDQIEYEYKALKELEKSGVTPRPLVMKKSGNWIKKGYLIMEFLEGRPLDYKRDLDKAAYILSKVHSCPFSYESLILAKEPFKLMYEEFISMFSVYKEWEDKDIEVEALIERLLKIAKNLGLEDKISRPCIINTELNNKNFIIGKTKEESYLVDWEKPLIGDCEQDLAHFSVPTTTNWKTDVIFSKKEVNVFLEEYEKYRKVDRRLFDKYYIFNCLRGITWCAMAKVEYSKDRALSSRETLAKINKFISKDFIMFIYNEFYKEYDFERKE